MFRIHPRFHDKSRSDSRTLSAAPAQFVDDDGRATEQAVVVYADGGPRLSITIHAALGLAHELADVLSYHRERTK